MPSSKKKGVCCVFELVKCVQGGASKDVKLMLPGIGAYPCIRVVPAGRRQLMNVPHPLSSCCCCCRQCGSIAACCCPHQARCCQRRG
jgi:hypothetical protein